MTSRSKLNLFASALALGAFVIGADPAVAGVESMHTPRDPERNCKEAHDVSSPSREWTPADGVLRLRGTGPERYEFYGQLMDLAPSAEVEGIRGAQARRIQGHAGPINAGRRCGGVGSIVIELTLPEVRQETRGTLLIGLERIPFIAVPWLMEKSTWRDENIGESRRPVEHRRSNGSGVAASPPITTTGNNQADCTVVACPAPGSGLVVIPGSSNGSVNSGRAVYGGDIATFGDCMDDAFGSVSVIDGSRLTVTLPRTRSAASTQCFRRSFLAHASKYGADVHATLSGASNFQSTYNISNPADGPPMTGRTHPERSAFHLLNFPEEAFRNLVGEYRYTVAIGPSAAPSELELILKTDPAYGIKRVGSAAARNTADAGLTAYPYQRVKSGQRFFWRVTSTTPGLAERCFSVTQGTVSPPVGAESFPLPTDVDPTTSCRQPFSVTVKPAVFETDATFDTGLFGKTLAFTPAVSTAIIAQPPSRIPPVTVPRGTINLPGS